MKGTILNLKGKTTKGKQRIKDFGSTWLVLKVIPLEDSQINKNWYIAPISTDDPWAERWINSVNDPDFEVKVIS